MNSKNLLKIAYTFLFTLIATWSMAMTDEDLAQFKIGLYVMLGLLIIGGIAAVIFIRRKPKDENGKIEAQAYSASQKSIKGGEGINNFYNSNLP